MGYKDICFKCRKAFNRGTNVETPILIKCPECGEIMHHQDNSRTIEFLKERIEEFEGKKSSGKKKVNVSS